MGMSMSMSTRSRAAHFDACPLARSWMSRFTRPLFNVHVHLTPQASACPCPLALGLLMSVHVHSRLRMSTPALRSMSACSRAAHVHVHGHVHLLQGSACPFGRFSLPMSSHSDEGYALAPFDVHVHSLTLECPCPLIQGCLCPLVAAHKRMSMSTRFKVTRARGAGVHVHSTPRTSACPCPLDLVRAYGHSTTQVVHIHVHLLRREDVQSRISHGRALHHERIARSFRKRGACSGKGCLGGHATYPQHDLVTCLLDGGCP